jgi:hypothetical protein
VRCNAENARRLKLVLRAFGFDELSGFQGELSPRRSNSSVRTSSQSNRHFTKISGVDFQDAWADRVSGDLHGVALPLISHDRFIQNKLAAGRAKDLADAEALEKTSADADRSR